jgi:hypothetical protein
MQCANCPRPRGGRSSAISPVASHLRSHCAAQYFEAATALSAPVLSRTTGAAAARMIVQALVLLVKILLPNTAALRQRKQHAQKLRERYLQQLSSLQDPKQLQQMTSEELWRHVQWRECLTEAVEGAARIAALESLQKLLMSHWRTPQFTGDVSEVQLLHFMIMMSEPSISAFPGTTIIVAHETTTRYNYP